MENYSIIHVVIFIGFGLAFIFKRNIKETYKRLLAGDFLIHNKNPREIDSMHKIV